MQIKPPTRLKSMADPGVNSVMIARNLKLSVIRIFGIVRDEEFPFSLSFERVAQHGPAIFSHGKQQFGTRRASKVGGDEFGIGDDGAPQRGNPPKSVE
ncbi:hypothetical protein CDL15_Pgr005210 [Punica granatum]|uniref:Uncharacterized protein n=1 Tax=Punica granatum TaxID=22663 RepID=A0A218WQJ1_PUNGR|nr:hypothetical protein CDL15_Pgr005210 [Punica granatum]